MKTAGSKKQRNDKERILEAFSTRAQKDGIRAVKMARLASELRMSATTLYNHFPSKADLVQAMVFRWAEELSASEAALPEDGEPLSADQSMLLWAEAWAESLARYTPTFWDELRADYPDAWRIFSREVKRRKAHGAALLRPHIAPEWSPEMALAILDNLIESAADPERCRRLGISRDDAIRTAIGIWRRGALDSRARS